MTPEELLEVITIAEKAAREDYTKRLTNSSKMHQPNWETCGERYCFYVFMYFHKALLTVIKNTKSSIGGKVLCK